MPKPTLEEVYDIPDPMLSDNFDIVFTNIPNGGDSRLLRIQCLSTALPGATISTVEIELFGHKIIYGARKTFSHTINVTLNETYDARVRASLENWLRAIRAKDTQTGNFSSDYAVSATLTVYDQTGAPAAQFKLHRVFPTELPEYSFEGAGNQAIQNAAQFSYGYVERVF